MRSISLLPATILLGSSAAAISPAYSAPYSIPPSNYGVVSSNVARGNPSNLASTTFRRKATEIVSIQSKTGTITNESGPLTATTWTSTSAKDDRSSTSQRRGDHNSLSQSVRTQHTIPPARASIASSRHHSPSSQASGLNNISPLYPDVVTLGPAAAEATLPGTAMPAPTTTSKHLGIQTVSGTTFPNFCDRIGCQTLVPIALLSAAVAASAELPALSIITVAEQTAPLSVVPTAGPEQQSVATTSSLGDATCTHGGCPGYGPGFPPFALHGATDAAAATLPARPLASPHFLFLKKLSQ